MALSGRQYARARSIYRKISACGYAFIAIELGIAQRAAGQCNPNPIVCENQNAGTTAWGISGNGDLTIQGFATDISVNIGQTISFKIDTPASKYHVDIYRLGYYQGNGGRFITRIQPSASLPQSQPACLKDPATNLADCGNWAVSASWQIPSTAVSGLYLAVPTRDDTGGASHIPFIVRNDASQSDILFQTSDETWEAYNPYGGHSLYGDTGFNINNRAFKVSYNRPYWTRTLEAATWLFNAEYPMIKWLEANGYDVTYFTHVDAVRNSALLTNHKIYLSVGHDEYWSGPARASVQAALNAGVNLAFFSGNEMFWKTRWENSIDGSGTPFRTLVCYKETLENAKIDPADPPTWTGTWMDPRFSPPADGGVPQNALTGTLFQVNGPGSDNTNLSIKVPETDGKMRFWRNTSIANLASGQTAVLPPGTLGYEWDVDADNGFRPSGLMDLSTATYNLTTDLLLDYGGTYGAGTATHHLTLYRAPSGALVFGAGTVQWSWGLDSDHDGGNNPPDVRMQQATLNLFADMGVQPGTIQAGLVPAVQSTDVTPPVSTITSPLNGSTVEFGSLVTITGTAADSGGGTVAAVEVSVDGGKTWDRATGRDSWSYSWTALASGSAHIQSRAIDDSGNVESPGPGITVSVPGQTISIDASTAQDAPGASTTVASPAFSTSAGNELLLAFIATDYLSGANTAVTGVSGGGLTWALVVRTNAESGTSEIWRAFAPARLTSVAVTATLSQPVVASLAVRTFTGVDTSGTNGSGAIGAVASAHAASGAPTAHLVTTRNGSWVFGVGNDYDNAIIRTPGAGQTVFHQYLSTSGDTYWMQMENAETGLSGTTVTLTDTQPTSDRYNLSICEILPAKAPTWSISGTISPSSASTTTTMQLSGTATTTAAVDASGNYSFNNLTNGNYVVTPNSAAFTFTPTSQPVTVNGANVTGINFNGTAVPTFSISGNAAVAGASMTLTPSGETGTNATTTADGSGNYTFSQVVNGSYTVTPAAPGVTFTPVSQNVTVNGANIGSVNFTAVAAPTWSISGTISPASLGANVNIALTGAGTGTVQTDSSGAFTAAGLANGTYTLTPSKTGVTFTPSSQQVTVNGADVTGIVFTASAAPPGLAIDANISSDRANASSTNTVAVSTNFGNELLLAFIGTDYISGSNTTVTKITATGLTWVLVKRTNVQSGTSEIWRAFAPAPLSNVTVTATLSHSVISSMTVVGFTGVDTSGTSGSGAIGATGTGNARTGAPTAGLITTRNGSWVIGVGNDFDNAIARTPVSGQSLLHQYLAASGDTYWVQMVNSPTPLSGTTVRIQDSAPTGDRYNLSICEVLPAQ